VRNKIGDAIAEVARQYTDDSISAPNGEREVWTDLLQTLFHASQSTDPGQREAAFKIFTTTPGIIEKQQQDVLQTVFTKGFADPDVSVCDIDLASGSSRLIRGRCNLLPWTLSQPSFARSRRSISKDTIHKQLTCLQYSFNSGLKATAAQM